MRLSPSVVFAACCVLVAAAPMIRIPATTADDPRGGIPIVPTGMGPPATILERGDVAPDVSWEAPGDRPQRLSDLRAHGQVLLVFCPTDAQLQALERDRDRLLGLRVIPAAVLDRNPSAVANLGRRLGLHYTLIPDAKSAIAEQFNVLDPASNRMARAWFVIGRSGRVRALDRTSLPEAGYARLVSAALDLPAPGAPLPSSAR
ncbi:MAG TPA: redoxin domain-containing protein [Terriglobales bacterium]|nr:redoxin domain-containing protein [Terriglobales bacterium]